VVVIGSHDMTLDRLASQVRRARPRTTVASSNVGSMGGLLALARGEAHLAGSHLLDEHTGEYNLSYIRRFLKGRGVAVINLVRRIQGLILPKGNPKGIASLDDLTRDDVVFLNRQRGSGTRILLDYRLRELGIEVECIDGYDREEYTLLRSRRPLQADAPMSDWEFSRLQTPWGLTSYPLHRSSTTSSYLWNTMRVRLFSSCLT